MRKLFTLIAIIVFTSCGDKTETGVTTKSEETTPATDTTKVDYAYSIEYPDDWETGNKLNTQMVLKSLKAFENENMEEAVKDFADTVTLEFDNFEAKMGKDSLLARFKRDRRDIKNLKIIMEDFESVKSRHRKDLEYVSLWYKQIWQDKKGKTDSIECMDDLRIQNGKITLLNEKVRHYPAKKM